MLKPLWKRKPVFCLEAKTKSLLISSLLIMQKEKGTKLKLDELEALKVFKETMLLLNFKSARPSLMSRPVSRKQRFLTTHSI